jgi:peptide/nickel transport system substrate-binding protein
MPRVSLALLVVVLMLALACSSDNPATSTTEPTAGPTTVATQPSGGAITRADTLISRGWGAGTQIANPEDFNPFTNLYQRDRQHYTINESLFYTNFNNGEVIPWQAESYSWNGDYTVLTIVLRDNVMWSDGEQLTAEDVVFTVDMLKDSAPELLMSGVMVEWIESAVATDELTVQFNLTKPGPRFFLDNIAQGQVGRFVVVPKHIWEGKDSRTFNFYDAAQGWPISTGPYEVVSTSVAIRYLTHPYVSRTIHVWKRNQCHISTFFAGLTSNVSRI